MTKLTVLIILLAVIVHFAYGFRKQKYTVKGQLFCGNEKAANVRVKLYDYDAGPDIDDVLQDGYTNNQGKFTLSGSTRELSRIDPKLKIYHNCNDGIKPCKRKWKLTLPKKYINRGAMDIGNWNLEIIQEDEDRDCIPN